MDNWIVNAQEIWIQINRMVRCKETKNGIWHSTYSSHVNGPVLRQQILTALSMSKELQVATPVK